MNTIFTYLLIVVTLIACQSSDIAPSSDSLGYGFYPLSKGQFQIYKIKETQYLISGETDSSVYQLKEEIVDSFLSGEDSTYIIYRYTRETETDEWEFLNTWQAKKNGYQLIVFEENTPFMKLTFPVKAGKKWNGNGFNTLESDDYEMDSLYFPYLNENELLFEKTLKVVQNDNNDFIVQLDKRIEKYALNVGLIEKEVDLLTFCSEDNCLGQQIIETGVKFRQTIIDYGKN